MQISRTLVIAAIIASAAPADTGEEAFARLSRLVGNWEAKTARGSVIRLSYRTVAADSVLVETFMTASGRETLTLCHRDGPDVVATHYCAQGNQPRLRLDVAGAGTTLQFTFTDATNLARPGASHLTRLRFQLRDVDHLDKTEVYTEDGKEDVTVLTFVRVSAALQ